MSYHCERWAQNIGDLDLAENGQSIDRFYQLARCTHFIMPAVVDEDANFIELDWNENPYCSEHDRTTSNNRPNIADEIEANTEHYICYDCETIWLDHEDYEEHRTDTHEDEDDDQEEHWHPIASTPPVSLHSSW